jgi:hypothetical protein
MAIPFGPPILATVDPHQSRAVDDNTDTELMLSSQHHSTVTPGPLGKRKLVIE